MGRLRLFDELVEAGGAVEGGGGGGGTGGSHQIARVVRVSGDYQTTSQTFVDIDTNNLVINMTTGGSWVLLLLAGSMYLGAGIQYACFDFAIDGVRQGQDKGVQFLQPTYYAGYPDCLARPGDGGEPHLPAAVAEHGLAASPARQQCRLAPPLHRDRDQVGANQ